MNNKMNSKIIIGLLALGLIGTMAYAEEPTISYAVKMEITYTGVLYQSTDGVNWTKVEGATSPYYVSMDDAKKLFFCSKESENKNITIQLSDTVNLDMIWIEPGTFTMGSPKGELDRDYDEAQHQVTLTKEYWLGKYEVTQAQYETVMGTNPSWYKGADLPVEMVSWFGAKEFCAKLTSVAKASGKLPEGYEFTLPTEAQWEYACRAGTTTALNNGENLSNEEKCPEMDEVGCYDGNSNEMTHPVGQKKPNAWGLYDMHGNVWEWCLDWNGDYPETAVVDPTGPDTGVSRVLRSGSWGGYATYCRSAFRNCKSPDTYNRYYGFRVALAPVQ